MEEETITIIEEEDTESNQVDVAKEQVLLPAEKVVTSIESTSKCYSPNAIVKLEPVIIDIKNKMTIVCNVVKACLEEKTQNAYYCMDDILNRLSYLTKLPNEVLSVIMARTKDNYILEDSMLETPYQDILLRRILTKYYLKKKIIPKSEFLTSVVDDHCYSYNLQQQLKRSGYIWRRLSNTQKAIIVEHPKQVIQRQRYLHKVIKYREENLSIVYIESKILTRADEATFHFQNILNDNINFIVVFFAVANNNEGFLQGNVFLCKTILETQDVIEDYIILNIVPCLTEPSLIILEEKPYYRKTLCVPTIDSTKSEMVKWLEIHGLPHEPTLHRSELFELIQRCNNKRGLHKFDAVLFCHGHKVLRRPPRTDYLNYYKPLWDNTSLSDKIVILVRNKSLEFWRNLEVTMKEQEKFILNEDLAMENIIDKIITMANNTDVNEWADAECDEEFDSLVQEEFVIPCPDSFTVKDKEIREEQYLCEIEKIQRVQKNTQTLKLEVDLD